MTTNTTPGFYADDTETYYVTPSGRVWMVQSEDELPEVRQVKSLPDGVGDVNGLFTPEEAIRWCGQIQAASGETLLESA